MKNTLIGLIPYLCLLDRFLYYYHPRLLPKS